MKTKSTRTASSKPKSAVSKRAKSRTQSQSKSTKSRSGVNASRRSSYDEDRYGMQNNNGRYSDTDQSFYKEQDRYESERGRRHGSPRFQPSRSDYRDYDYNSRIRDENPSYVSWNDRGFHEEDERQMGGDRDYPNENYWPRGSSNDMRSGRQGYGNRR